ncbi:hypothetical protein [Spirosoma sp.]|uniref:hypothetical protein n=1 Tax=Spirosoma sp. TaxID=1899569 RepID=UPI0026226540|nr:hypothetical protein [Spirosoma sp.]MCX6217588.1 hypothetical protein [Spirosoma sp.]
MPAPCLELTHLKTSQQFDNELDLDVMVYWFQWSNRTRLGKLEIEIELLDQAGAVVAPSRTHMPAVKIVGYTGKNPQHPVYSASVWIQIMDLVRSPRPVSFRYYTVTGLFKRSETVTAPLDGAFNDISIYK